MAVRVVVAVVGVALLAAGCGSGHATSHAAFSLAPPPPARVATARFVVSAATPHGRMSLWVARNQSDELCVGWRLGPGRPTRFRCQLHGLERPALWVQAAGGTGGSPAWGGAVGLVAPGVTRVLLNDSAVRLRPTRGLAGWRTFASDDVPSSLAAYEGGREVLEDDGLWVNPDGLGCACTKRGTSWWGTYAYVPEEQRGTDARATRIALMQPGVRAVISAHGPAWVDRPVPWGKCAGGWIGAAVMVHLIKPATFRTTVPFDVVAPDGLHVAYTTGVHRVLAIGSEDMNVDVDTHSWRVVGVDAAFDTGEVIPLGTIKKPRPGGGYDDPSKCPKGD